MVPQTFLTVFCQILNMTKGNVEVTLMPGSPPSRARLQLIIPPSIKGSVRAWQVYLKIYEQHGNSYIGDIVVILNEWHRKNRCCLIPNFAVFNKIMLTPP